MTTLFSARRREELWRRRCAAAPLYSAYGMLLATALLSSVARAQSADFTIDETLARLQRGAARIEFAKVDSAAARMLDSLAVVLRAHGAGKITTSQMASVIVRRHATFADVARWNPDDSTTAILSQPGFRDAVLKLPLVVNGSLEPELSARLPRAAVDSILVPIDLLGRAVRAAQSARVAERLRHFEIKYGPDAPALNIAEVGLNYLGQWVPPFRSRNGDPSRYELIASYRPMELVLARQGGANAKVLSAGQVGVRWYHWDAAWGRGNALFRALRPRYAAAGVYALAGKDEPLRAPWQSGRLGAFLGWGDLHVAYVGKAPRQVLIGTGKHIVPYVF